MAAFEGLVLVIAVLFALIVFINKSLNRTEAVVRATSALQSNDRQLIRSVLAAYPVPRKLRRHMEQRCTELQAEEALREIYARH